MKIKIMIEKDGKVETFEADRMVIVSQNDGSIMLTQHNTSEPDAVGLLEVGQWHVLKAWEKANSK